MVEKGSVDGGWAWVVLCAATAMMVFVGCAIYGIGVIHVFLLETFQEDPVKTSWVGALTSSLVSMVGPISGVMSSRISCRAAMFTGGLMLLVGYSSSAFVTHFDLLFLTYGMLVGAGAGLAYTPGIVVLGYYFEKKRDVACGIAIGGCGIGMMAGPMAIRWLTGIYGWRGMFLIMGGINFHVCLFASLCFPSEVEMEQKRIRASCTSSGKKRWANHFRIFRNPAFMLVLLTVFIFSFGAAAVYLHFPKYCIDKGATGDEVTLLLTVTSLCNIVSRVLAGFGMGTDPHKKYIYYFGAYGISAIVVLTFPLYSSSTAGRFAFSALFGMYTTVNYVVLNPITVELLGLYDLALGLGLEAMVCGLGFLLGPPATALVVQLAGEYSAAAYFTGGLMMVSSILATLIVLVKKKPHGMDVEETEMAHICQLLDPPCAPEDVLKSWTSLPGMFGATKENIDIAAISHCLLTHPKERMYSEMSDSELSDDFPDDVVSV